jgi:hypothetical protein
MAKFLHNFQQGDRVEHDNRGLGIVSAIKDGLVHVVYDKRSERTEKHWVGVYDDNWFRNVGLLRKVKAGGEGKS